MKKIFLGFGIVIFLATSIYLIFLESKVEALQKQKLAIETEYFSFRSNLLYIAFSLRTNDTLNIGGRLFELKRFPTVETNTTK